MDNIHYLNLSRDKALGRTGPEDDWLARYEESQRGPCDHLLPIVGDAGALEALDATPLPDEPFDWSGVDDEDRARVAEILRLSDACCDALLDVEYRTIARRILARVARRDPRCLRRTAHLDRFAAALVYLAGHASGLFGRRGRLTAHRLWSWWNVSSCTARARTVRSAAGLDTGVDYGGGRSIHDRYLLSDATLLHSTYREQLCHSRDYLKKVAPRPKWKRIGDGRKVETQAELVRPQFAFKVTFGPRVMVMLGLGQELPDAHPFVLSVTDAHDLVQLLQRALDSPKVGGAMERLDS